MLHVIKVSYASIVQPLDTGYLEPGEIALLRTPTKGERANSRAAHRAAPLLSSASFKQLATSPIVSVRNDFRACPFLYLRLVGAISEHALFCRLTNRPTARVSNPVQI